MLASPHWTVKVISLWTKVLDQQTNICRALSIGNKHCSYNHITLIIFDYSFCRQITLITLHLIHEVQIMVLIMREKYTHNDIHCCQGLLSEKDLGRGREKS